MEADIPKILELLHKNKSHEVDDSMDGTAFGTPHTTTTTATTTTTTTTTMTDLTHNVDDFDVFGIL